MLKLDTRFVQQIQDAKTIEDLYPLLQNAIELEHATIPPYLTAMFSLKPHKLREIWDIIHSIVIEEMMHMTISSNILNALGGHPFINHEKFVPEYPGPLPMGIGDGLIVGLRKYSKDQVKNVFMEIEEPEHRLDLKAHIESIIPDFHTIGEFYNYLQKKIDEIAPDILPGNPNLQVTSSFFSSELLFPILTKEDACRAIDVIVEQGEGTATSPIDPDGEIAHYYKFEELYVGKRLIEDSNAPHGYSYSGAVIPFDINDVNNLFPNTKAHMLPTGSEERRRVDQFNESYHTLLNGLHKTFNGTPQFLANTIGVMFDLKLYAEKLCGTPFPGKPGYTIGPTFEFQEKVPV